MRLFYAITFACSLVACSAFSQVELSEVQVVEKQIQRKNAADSYGFSATILPDSVIRLNPTLSVSELLNRQAGIIINGATQPQGSVQNVYFRGANRGFALVLVDGVPQYDVSDISQVADLNTIPLSQIERIEILRGGQSVVYGSDAAAGVINIITKKNAQKPVNGNFAANYGSFQTTGVNAGVNGKVRALTYRLNYDRQQSAGISAAAVNPVLSSIPVFDKDGFRRNALIGDVRQTIGKNAAIYANGRYSNYQNDLDAGAYIDDKDYTARHKNLQLGLGGTFFTEKGYLNAAFQRTGSHRNFVDDSTDVPVGAFAKYSAATYDSYANFYEFYGNFRLSEQINLLAGIDFQQLAMAQTYESDGYYGAYTAPPITEKNARLTNASGYATLTANKNNYGVEVGVRGNQNSGYGLNFSYNVSPYLKLKNVRLFAALAKSYKNPSLYQVFSEYGNAELQPQNAHTFDLGGVFRKNNVSFSTTYFYRNTTDIIAFLPINDFPYGIYQNLDRQVDNGIEAEFSVRNNTVSFTANYTYLIASKTEAGGHLETNPAFFRRPKHAINAEINWQPLKKLSISPAINFQSKRTDVYYDPSDFNNLVVDLSAFTQLSARINYTIRPKTSIGVSGRNLLNAFYQETYGFNSLPRNFAVFVNIGF